MGQGQGSVTVNQRREPSGAPFTAGSAENGLSVDLVTGRIVSGQDIGAVGDPAQLLSSREVPLNAFNFQFGKAGDRRLLLDLANDVYQFGDIDNVTGGSFINVFNVANALQIFLRNNRALQLVQQFTNNNYTLGDIDNTDGGMVIGLTANNSGADETFSVGRLGGAFISVGFTAGNASIAIGDLNGLINPVSIDIQSGINEIRFNGDNFLHRTTTALLNNAGAAAATLLNAPVAGNPTKWIPINDNGVIRNIPAW